jgi:hypothetical protein
MKSLCRRHNLNSLLTRAVQKAAGALCRVPLSLAQQNASKAHTGETPAAVMLNRYPRCSRSLHHKEQDSQ